jgi:predicted ATPase
VVDFLARKEMLLIFDNFEHLLPAVSFLSALLAECPGLHLLVTSRARLHLYGEHEFVVAPLGVPDGDESVDVASAPAVRLFCLRAQAVRADFRLTPALAPVVAAMCRRLDGLPLAIELAAARIKLFSVQELQERLEHRLPLLTQSAAGLPPRLQGLESAIAWSYGLLTPVERALLRRLAVFAKGISLAAVESVCCFSVAAQTPVTGDTAAALTAEDIIGGVEALLDQSLLQRASAQAGDRVCSRGCCGACPKRLLGTAIQSESRFTMLETIREFALKQLEANAELSLAQRRHAEYFTSWAEQAAEHLHGPEQAIWLARLEDQLGNLRAALAWLLEAGDVELAARLACALGIFWQRRGHYSEGRRWLQQVLAQMAHFEAPVILRARTLQSAAVLAYRKGDPLIAEGWLAESQNLFREVSDQVGLARVLFDLGWIAIDRSDWATATNLNRQSLAMARASNDLCAIYRALTNLGWTHLNMDEKNAAAAFFEEAYALARRIGHTKGVAVSLANLGWIALCQGDLARCVSLAQESLRLCHLLGEREVLAENLEILAAAAIIEGDAFRASQLSSGAEAVWATMRVARPPLPFPGLGRSPLADAVAPNPAKIACQPHHQQDGVPWLDVLVAAALGCTETDGLHLAV